jgi:hypothetical protein
MQISSLCPFFSKAETGELVRDVAAANSLIRYGKRTLPCEEPIVDEIPCFDSIDLIRLNL